MNEQRYVHIGKGSVVNSRRMIAILRPGSASSQRLMDRAMSTGKLFNCAAGKKTRSLILMDDGSVLQSTLSYLTLMQRFNGGYESEEDETDNYIEDEEEEQADEDGEDTCL